jgi:dTDP-4-dehydrorhamnose 3,5-epimerase
MDQNKKKSERNLSNFTKVTVTSLKQIKVPGGNVKRYIRATDPNFKGFGEVYFSHISFNQIKAWKRHKRMTLNITVPIGWVKFVFWDEELDICEEITIGDKAYNILTIKPNIWFGFKGMYSPTSLVANFTDMIHDTTEVDKREIDDINFSW